MRRCIFILGTRAQVIKVAPVLHLAASSGLQHSVWFTGQHRESIDDLLSDFEITSEISMSDSRREHSSVGKLARWLPSALHGCRRYVRSAGAKDNVVPLVVVHGDTLSTVVGALAARSSGADVVHLESGLTSLKLLDPFPEEILRRVTFNLARYAVCPNASAASRMRRYRNCEVIDTRENTMLDCVRYAIAKGSRLPGDEVPAYFVASIHRFENIYRKSCLTKIVNDVIAVSEYGNVHFVLHPPTERQLSKCGLLDRLTSTATVQVADRMPFTRFLALISGARGIFSDGGSNQEELSYLGVPAVLFRERSERPDGFGANIVLRKDAGPSLADFVRSGGLDALRRPSRLLTDARPSRTTIEALHQWSAR